MSELDCEGGRCQVTRWLQLDLYNASTQMFERYIFINVMTIHGGSLNYFLDKKILDMERLKNQLMSEIFTNFMISTRLDKYNNDNIFI